MPQVKTRKNTSLEAYSEAPELCGFEFFLDFLQKNVNQSRFTPQIIAESLNISEDLAIHYLLILKKSFLIFREREAQNSRKKPNLQDISFKTNARTFSETKNPRHIEATISQLKTLSDFHYISSKRPLKEKNFTPNFTRLIQDFPEFFVQTGAGWIVAPMAKFFAEQFQSFQRINSIPKDLIFDKTTLVVK